MEQPPLIKSRKFWLMTADAFVSLVVYFVTKYLAPAAADDVIKVLVTLQPVVIVVITSITVQNVAVIRASRGR